MILSKKALIAIGASLATTTVVIGTTAGVIVNNQANTVQSNLSTPIEEVDKQNQPTKSETTLIDLAKKINKEAIFIKKLDGDALNDLNKKETIDISSTYAFNVLTKQLFLKEETIKLPQDITATFNLDIEQNTASNLNSGRLNVKVTLKNTKDSTQATTDAIELNGFKVATISEDLKSLFENEGKDFQIKIDPKKDNRNGFEFIDLELLNSTFTRQIAKQPSRSSLVNRHDSQVASLGQDESEEDEETQTVSETGLTSWLKADETKKDKVIGVSLVGKVKLSQISKEGNGDSEKTIFHLVAKDEKNKIKLVKDKEEILVSEIKSTNIVASDVALVPLNINKQGTNGFLETLRKTTDGEMPNGKYLDDKKDKSLNRDLYIDLNKMNGTIRGNNVFINPYLVKQTEQNKSELPFAIWVKFGKNDYLTTYRTDNEKQLAELKEAGFSFGIYSKQLMTTDQNIQPQTFTNKKMDLEKYFVTANYSKPSIRQSKGSMPMDKYPAGFDLVEIKHNQLVKDLKLKATVSKDQMKSTNTVTFVDYSYKGIDASKVLYTPSISLIHLEKDTLTQ